MRRVVLEDVLDSAYKSGKRVAVKTKLFSHSVRALKADSLYLVAKAVRVFLGYINRCRAPALVYLYDGRRAKVVAEEHHRRADARLGFEVLADLSRLVEAYSGNVGEPIGMILKHLKRFVTEPLNYLDRRLLTYSLYCARGQIAQDRGCVLRHVSLVLAYGKLPAVFRIVLPLTVKNKRIALVYVGHDSCYCYEVIAVRAEICYGVTVFFV